jgi:hypothetical protein
MTTIDWLNEGYKATVWLGMRCWRKKKGVRRWQKQGVRSVRASSFGSVPSRWAWVLVLISSGFYVLFFIKMLKTKNKSNYVLTLKNAPRWFWAPPPPLASSPAGVSFRSSPTSRLWWTCEPLTLLYKIKMPAIKLLKWFWLRTKLIFRTTIGFEHGRCCIRRKKQKRTWKIVTNFWRRRSWRSSLSLDGNSRIELKLSLLSIHLSTLLVFLSYLSDVFQYKPKSFWFVFGRSII